MRAPGILRILMIYVVLWMMIVGVLGGWVCCEKPSVVKVGAIFTHDSVIGKAAVTAMEMAVSDINKDPTILHDTQLRLITEDANSSVFISSIEAFQVIEQEVVAIIGPQSSSIAHMISTIANDLQIPLVSYAATDPTLSALQFPYFIRTAPSDSYQMAAVAELIDFHGWKEVIAIYVDDDYGRNGISALAEELGRNKMKISYKLLLLVESGSENIRDMLNRSKMAGPRVYVVHVNPDPIMTVFRVAHELGMMSADYVWIATDWFSTTLDSLAPVDKKLLRILRGTVSLRWYTPESAQKRWFLDRWNSMSRNGSVGLNHYGLCTYDTVWTVARAVDEYIKGGGNVTFSLSGSLSHQVQSTGVRLGELRVFDGGARLLRKILHTNFTGLTGQIRFGSDRNILPTGYDVINIDETAVRTVGFWSNSSGFSLSHSEQDEDRYSRVDQKLRHITWPGGKTKSPRGWVIADIERPLRIGVPNRYSFQDFVMEDHTTRRVRGYCIDIFQKARELVPYDIPYTFVPFGNGSFNPSYDGLIKMVADDIFDGVVGDIAIVTNRTRIVDFSQPYASTGLVIVAPINNQKSSAWVFLRPFTVEMWCMTAASFVLIAVVIWVLEHRVNKDFRGPPMRQLVTMFMFSFMTLFKKNQEDTVSPLGRMVMVVWLFLLMVITSSYTASLTSILTIQQLSSPITGIDSLIASDWPIGYQVGSFAYSYLADNLYISPSRLVSLGSPEEYEWALRLGPSGGGVGAIVDELPYVELFLSGRSEFGIIGQAFTQSGWGFAFKRDSPLAIDISTAILKLSENGQLQEIHQRWFCKTRCLDGRTTFAEPNQLQLISFWGLYLLCGAVCVASLLVFLFNIVRSYIRYKRRQMLESITMSENVKCHCTEGVSHFLDFVDKREEDTKQTPRADQHDRQLRRQNTEPVSEVGKSSDSD